MARKHLLSKITGQTSMEAVSKPVEDRAAYARRGASRSMMQTLDEMAENSMRLLEGEAIVQLDPAVLDPSPFADRIGEDPEQFQALVSAIQAMGQSSPILVRPHPESDQRFIIVYGHRRAKAARELGVPVRAVIKPLEEISHVIAQGQENTARSDLTFIEKALFAKKLLGSGISKDDIKKALTVDDTLLSRMLSVAEQVPPSVLDAIGAAKGIGRDRWEELKKLMLLPGKSAAAVDLADKGVLDDMPQQERFAFLFEALKSRTSSRRTNAVRQPERSWTLTNSSVKVVAKDGGRVFTLAVKSKEASEFGSYISENLERFYEDYLRSKAT